jgi:hypothetical protein
LTIAESDRGLCPHALGGAQFTASLREKKGVNSMKGWRTLAINAAVILGGVLAYLDTAGLRDVLPARYAWVPIALGAANVALRLITTGPAGSKG